MLFYKTINLITRLKFDTACKCFLFTVQLANNNSDLPTWYYSTHTPTPTAICSASQWVCGRGQLQQQLHFMRAQKLDTQVRPANIFALELPRTRPTYPQFCGARGILGVTAAVCMQIFFYVCHICMPCIVAIKRPSVALPTEIIAIFRLKLNTLAAGIACVIKLYDLKYSLRRK